MTIDRDTLTALAREWIGGDRSAGPALYDALDEVGWPLTWEPFNGYGASLIVAGHKVGEVWQEGDPHLDNYGWWVFRASEDTPAPTFAMAQQAAEAALRRALQGG